MGDPTVATAENGKKFLEAAVNATVELVKEIRALPLLPRKDHH
jgi:creatinine amidohydrolase